MCAYTWNHWLHSGLMKKMVASLSPPKHNCEQIKRATRGSNEIEGAIISSYVYIRPVRPFQYGGLKLHSPQCFAFLSVALIILITRQGTRVPTILHAEKDSHSSCKFLAGHQSTGFSCTTSRCQVHVTINSSNMILNLYACVHVYA